MRLLLLPIALLWFFSSAGLAESLDLQPTSLLESKDFNQMKKEYNACVMTRGLQLLDTTDYDNAMKYAPMICRRGLLRVKRLMLESAFKVDVANDLVDSVAEGVQIDLATTLLEAKLAEQKL
jgi:hypothetical protein